MTLLLMAAGSGSRYGKLKQFDELGPAKEFLLEFSIYDAIHNGFDHIVVVTKAMNQVFLNDYLTERLPDFVSLAWGTAHAVWAARHVMQDDFVIINADDYYGNQAFEGAAKFIRSNNSDSSYAIVGYKLKDTLSDFGTVSRGVCSVHEGKLTSIEELTKIEGRDGNITDLETGRNLADDTPVSMNFWICHPSIMDYIETYFTNFLKRPENHEKSEIYLPFVAQEMMSAGLIDIHVIPSNSPWFGVTYYDDKTIAVNTLKKLTDENLYPSPLWN
jgi:NDP-sugar pyrophosphorylase family protein